MPSTDTQIIDKLIELGVSKSKAENIVRSMSAVDKSRSLMDAAFLQEICKSVTPAGPVPIPYPNVGQAADMTEGSKKVKIDDKEVTLKDKSTYDKTTGDEPGTEKLGIGKINGEKLSEYKDLAKEGLKKIKDEGQKMLRYAGDMDPDGHKLLAITLIIGLTGGFLASSINCSRRINTLKREMEYGGLYQENGLRLEQGGRPYGTDIFGSFEIRDAAWDTEAQEVTVNVTNTGSTMITLFSLSVHSLEETENLYSVHIHEPYGSLAPGSIQTYTWTANLAEAPTGYLTPGGRYRVTVTSQTGLNTVWIETIPNP
jgi:hypothetical protein